MARNLTAGLPRKKYVAGRLFDDKLEEPEVEAFIDEVEALAEDKPVPKQDWRLLRGLGIAIAVFASWATGFNSYEWFSSLRPAYIAVPMAITMVGASVLLPDFGILLFQQKKRAIGGGVFLAGVLATLFCMVTTVAALYNTHTWRVEDASLSNRQGIIAQQTLADRVMDRDRILGDIRVQSDLMRATQDKIDRLDPQDTLLSLSQALQNRFLAYQRTKQEYERALAVVDREIAALRGVGGSVVSRVDFFGFLAQIFKGDAATVEFLTAAVPAVFLEVVAPVMVAVVMFL